LQPAIYLLLFPVQERNDRSDSLLGLFLHDPMPRFEQTGAGDAR
jgi:hypothetical protein